MKHPRTALSAVSTAAFLFTGLGSAGCAKAPMLASASVDQRSDAVPKAGPSFLAPVERLPQATHEPTRYHRGKRTAGAFVLIDAPVDLVFAHASKYETYPDLFPALKNASVLERTEQYTDVRMETPLLGKSLTVWAKVRFEPFDVPDGRGFVGKLIEGNVDDIFVACRMTAASPTQTHVQLEMTLDPSFPAPRKLLLGELGTGAVAALRTFRDRSEADFAARSASTSPASTSPAH
jgi:hypothetical protein